MAGGSFLLSQVWFPWAQWCWSVRGVYAGKSQNLRTAIASFRTRPRSHLHHPQQNWNIARRLQLKVSAPEFGLNTLRFPLKVHRMARLKLRQDWREKLQSLFTRHPPPLGMRYSRPNRMLVPLSFPQNRRSLQPLPKSSWASFTSPLVTTLTTWCWQ